MLAEIFMVRSEAAARLQQETALLSSSTFTPFTPNNQFLFKDRAAFPDDPRWETGNEEVSYGRSRPISAIAIFSTLCATPKCPQHASKIFGPKLWFRGGISREGSYMRTETLVEHSTYRPFCPPSSPSLPPSFPFLLASAVPLLSWTFDALLRLRQRWASRRMSQVTNRRPQA